MLPKRKYSGVLLTVSNTSSHVIHFLSAEILSSPQSPFAIWAYFWTATCPWTLTCRGLYPAVLQLCDRYVASVVPSLSQFLSLSDRHLVVTVALTLWQRQPHRNISRPLQDRLQSVLNAAARLVCNGRKYDHITPLLRDLHWLRIPERIAFNLAVLVCSVAVIARHQNTWRETCNGQSTMNHVSDSDLVVRRSRLKKNRRSSLRRGCTSCLERLTFWRYLYTVFIGFLFGQSFT